MKARGKKLPQITMQALDCAKVHPALKGYFSYCFHKTALRYRSKIEACLAQFNLIPPQLGILRVIEASGPMSQIALGEELGIDKATMVKLIDGLEKPQYIRRVGDTKDRRIKLIYITPKGKKVFEKGVKVGKKIEENFLSVLTETERKSLKEIILKLLESTLEPKA
jgi:DNA-binding MarR family transcriptional regulator